MSADSSTPSAPRQPPGAPAVAALAACFLIALAAPPGALAADARDRPPSMADIELRKSLRRAPRPAAPAGTASPAAAGAGGRVAASAAGPESGARGTSRLIAAAAALGEPLKTSGALHLPGVGGRGMVLDGGRHPVVEYGTGRRAILDPAGALGAGAAAEISQRWPGYSVVQTGPGADMRSLLGRILDVSGYASVARSTPVSFGRGATVRIAPDFVVLKGDRDLLEGETLLLSVVERGEPLPPELRELAAGHRIRTVEVDGEGVPVGSDRASWADPSGRLTTVEGRRPWLVLAEVATAIGLDVDRPVASSPAVGGAALSVAARISGESGAVLVLTEPPGPEARAALAGRGETPLVVSRAGDLPGAIRALLARFQVAAIGPPVEFFRPPGPGAKRRFTISVPGWLIETRGRRLLITGAGPQPLLKRYLGREAIDILEYRVRER